LIVLAVSMGCHAATVSNGAAGEPAAHPVAATAFLDAARVRPGDTFTLGVQLVMQPGWHVYWRNPGDAGLPVSIRIGEGGGFKTGEIAWPVPIRFMQPGDIVGYGYTDSVLLTVPVTAPVSMPAGRTESLHVDVSWLVCKDVCIPGRASLDVPVEIGAQLAPANDELFRTWRDRVPTEGPTPFAVANETGSIDAQTRRGQFRRTLEWPAGVTDVAWFPFEDPALAVSDVAVRPAGPRSVVLEFTVERLAGQSPASGRLDSVVAFTTADGQRRGAVLPIEIDRPVKPPKTKLNQ
jgi:thiol:disulfide interchange protein DsbD